ncbi:MAG: hypothetical protein M3Y80_10280 [Verrucomicrobiota bacterium]|nr:hypothetical protein [Verrucomicrobiota bacterium]
MNKLQPTHAGSPQASAEIQAYIAARDMAVVEAEQATTDVTLNRAFLAVELVESFLAPARSPYQAQSLPPTEAARERQRCDGLKRRIQQLRACAVAAA